MEEKIQMALLEVKKMAVDKEKDSNSNSTIRGTQDGPKLTCTVAKYETINSRYGRAQSLFNKI